jgi:hypothetical protein
MYPNFNPTHRFIFFDYYLKHVVKAYLLYVAFDPSVETDGNKYSPLQNLFLFSSSSYCRWLQPVKLISDFSFILPLSSANGFD